MCISPCGVRLPPGFGSSRVPPQATAGEPNHESGKSTFLQEGCPWAVKFGPEQTVRPEYEAVVWPADSDGDRPLPSLDGPDLVEFTERILAMSGKEYRRVFAESPLAHPGRKGMLRNLSVALGNWGATSAEAAERVRPVLERAAADAAELVREHAEWGLQQVPI